MNEGYWSAYGLIYEGLSMGVRCSPQVSKIFWSKNLRLAYECEEHGPIQTDVARQKARIVDSRKKAG